jgi:hypothetical protein
MFPVRAGYLKYLPAGQAGLPAGQAGLPDTGWYVGIILVEI